MIYNVSRREKPSILSELLGVLTILTCPVPIYVLALTRLIKLCVQYSNPGQTICMKNYLNSEKPPLGMNLNICVDNNSTFIIEYSTRIQQKN